MIVRFDKETDSLFGWFWYSWSFPSKEGYQKGFRLFGVRFEFGYVASYLR